MSTLSTVIGYGLDSAKPASPRAGYIYYSTDTGLLERYSGSAWVALADTQSHFLFSTTTTDSDPGSGTLRFNSVTPASVSEIYIDDNDVIGSINYSGMFQGIVGAYILIHEIGDESKYLLCTVDAASNETPSYTKWAVTPVAQGSLPTDGALVELHIFGGGGGSASTTLWWDDPKCNIISHVRLHDGDIVNPLGEPIQLISGSADGDGQNGAGGFTETTVACTCVYDTSPANSAERGYQWFDQDIQMQTGQYFRASVRFPVKDDQSLFVGFCESSQFDDAGIKTAGEGVGIHLQGGTDTNWQVVHNDGATGQTKVDTGRAWGANDWLNVEIYIYDTGGGTMNAKVWINGTLEATITTNLPAASTITCRPFIQSWFQSAGDTVTYDQVIFVNHGFWASYDQGELETNGWATSL